MAETQIERQTTGTYTKTEKIYRQAEIKTSRQRERSSERSTK